MMDYQLLSYGPTVQDARAGLRVEGYVFDVAALTKNDKYLRVIDILQDWPNAEAVLSEATSKIGHQSAQATRVNDGLLLQAPVLYPGQIFAAGANYKDHIAEMARVMSQPVGANDKDLGLDPWHFIKPSRSCVVGPESVVKRPDYSKALDWEIELAVVIGRPARDIGVADALSHVAGYTIANDLSVRDQIGRPKVPQGSPFFYDWNTMKGFEGACPMGPWLTPARQIRDPQSLSLKLWVGSELMQDSNTNQMVFTIAEQISFLSTRLTLNPGDVIMTGTPAGVGMPRRRFLNPGEEIRLEIDQIGSFRHTVA